MENPNITKTILLCRNIKIVSYVLKQDGKRSAQFEQTLLVTDTGCDILTRRLDADGAPYFETQSSNITQSELHTAYCKIYSFFDKNLKIIKTGERMKWSGIKEFNPFKTLYTLASKNMEQI